MSKPIIAVIGRSGHGLHGDMNYDRDALIYFISLKFFCEINLIPRLDSDSQQEVEELCFIFKQRRLATALILQDRYGDDRHEVTAKILKNRLSMEFPILFVKNGMADYDLGKLGYFYDDPALIKAIETILSSFRPSTNYFGVETKRESVFIQQQLEKAYRINYRDSMAPSNDFIVLEAIRLRLLPSELIKKEFDNVLIGILENPTIDNLTLEKERESIKHLLEDPEKLMSLLESSADSVSRGYEIAGFAIDPITLQYSYFSGFGKHRLTTIDLVDRLSRFYLMIGNSFIDDYELQSRFIEGEIFFQVPGFKTPIMRFYGRNKKEDVEKVVRHLSAKEKYIFIDVDHNLLQ